MLPRSISPTRFVIAWTTSASLTVAAQALDTSPAEVAETAAWMMSQGVKLKPMPTKTKEDASTSKGEESTLTARQWAFAEQHYTFAYQYAKQQAERRHGTFARQAPDIIESAALDSLLKVATRSTDPDFRPATAKAMLKSAISRNVRDRLTAHFGTDGSKKPQFASSGVERLHVVGREREPWQDFADAEEEPTLSFRTEQAKRVLGSVSDEKNTRGGYKEYHALKAKALELGIITAKSHPTISTDGLRDLIARHVRRTMRKSSRNKGKGSTTSSRQGYSSVVAFRHPSD